MLQFEVSHGKRTISLALDDNATVHHLRLELQSLTNVRFERQTLSSHRNRDLDAVLRAKNFARKLIDCGAKVFEANKIALVGAPATELQTTSESRARAHSEDDSTRCASSGRNEFDWFAISADDILQQMIESGAVAWLADAAFDADRHDQLFLAKLQSLLVFPNTCPGICDVGFVAEGLRRIYAGSRIISEILPCRTAHPLNIPLLHSVLICVVMREFIRRHRDGWIAIESRVFDHVIGTREFWLRCALLAFPSLATIAESAMIHDATVDEERDYAAELLSPAAKDFMRRMWSACEIPGGLTANSVSELTQFIIEKFGANESSIEDTVICSCSLQHAFAISLRGPAECLKDVAIADYRLTQAALDALRCSTPEEFLDSVMDRDFGNQWIRNDADMQDAFKDAFVCFKADSVNIEQQSERIRSPEKLEFFKSFCRRSSKFIRSTTASVFAEYDVLPRLRGDLRGNSFLVRVCALRWPSLVEAEGLVWPMFSPDPMDDRAKHLMHLAEYDCFGAASRAIIERVWNTSIALTVPDVTAGIPAMQPADQLLAKELVQIALALQQDAEMLLDAAAQEACEASLQSELSAELDIHQAFYDESAALRSHVLLVKREDLLRSSIAAFQAIGPGSISANAIIIRFEGEESGSASDEETFRAWLHDVSTQLFTTPLFLPVHSSAHGAEICLRLNPLPSAIGLEHAEPLLRLLGFVLGMSLIRKVPVRKYLSSALANNLMPVDRRQLGLDDLQHELPEEFHWLSSLQGKSEDELDQIFDGSSHDDSARRGFTTPSRISQLCKTMEYLKKQASPRSPRGAFTARFLGDQSEGFQVRSCDRVQSSNVDDAISPAIGSAKTLRGCNFREYIALVVNKHCISNIRELVYHVKAAFQQVVSKDKLIAMADSPAALVELWSGDAFLNDAQFVEKWKKVSVFETCDEVTEFWGIMADSKNKDLRAAVVQWSTGLRYIPFASLSSSSSFHILRDADGNAAPTAQAFGGKLGQITLPCCSVKGQLREKLVLSCRNAGFL